MSRNPYEAPTTPLADRGPKGRGFIPDWILIFVAFVFSQPLLVYVVSDVAAILYWEVLAMPMEGVTTGVLCFDTALSAMAEFGMFWLGALLARYRPERTVVRMTIATLVATLIWRSVEGDYKTPLFFPLWYEVGIFVHVSLAGAAALWLYRRRLRNSIPAV